MIILQTRLQQVLLMTLVIAFLGINVIPTAAQKAIRNYSIPGQGTLELNVPAAWESEAHKPQESLPPTIIFNPPGGNDFQVMVTVLWNKKREQDFNSQNKVRPLVKKDGKKLLPNTVEAEIVLKEMKGVTHTGYYFSVTDKAPNPGEYRYMTRGAIGVGSLLLNFTILHRVRESQSVQEALAMLRDAKQRAK